MAHPKDITNKRFGRLVAIKPTNLRRHKKIIWITQCDCGEMIIVCCRDLISGNTKSCGCLQREAAIRMGISNWRGGRRSQGKYVSIKRSNHPRADELGYVREHILVAEKALGKPLPLEAIIHHWNYNGKDNRNSNLVICENNAYHIFIHKRMRDANKRAA